MTFTAEEVAKLRAGQPVDAGGHRWMMCRTCGRPIKTTGFFGSWHQCLTPEDQAAHLRYPDSLFPRHP